MCLLLNVEPFFLLSFSCFYKAMDEIIKYFICFFFVLKRRKIDKILPRKGHSSEKMYLNYLRLI